MIASNYSGPNGRLNSNPANQFGLDPITQTYKNNSGVVASGPGQVYGGAPKNNSTAPNQYGPNTFNFATGMYEEAKAPAGGGGGAAPAGPGGGGSDSLAGLLAAGGGGGAAPDGAGAGGPGGAKVLSPTSNNGSPSMDGLMSAGDGGGDGGGANMLAGPTHFRQNIGARMIPDQNSALAGLRRVY